MSGGDYVMGDGDEGFLIQLVSIYRPKLRESLGEENSSLGECKSKALSC